MKSSIIRNKDSSTISEEDLRPWVPTHTLADDKIRQELLALEDALTHTHLNGRWGLSQIDSIPAEILELRQTLSDPDWYQDKTSSEEQDGYEQKENDEIPETNLVEVIQRESLEDNLFRDSTGIAILNQISKPSSFFKIRRKKQKKMIRGAAFMSNPRVKSFMDSKGIQSNNAGMAYTEFFPKSPNPFSSKSDPSLFPDSLNSSPRASLTPSLSSPNFDITTSQDDSNQFQKRTTSAIADSSGTKLKMTTNTNAAITPRAVISRQDGTATDVSKERKTQATTDVDNHPPPPSPSVPSLVHTIATLPQLKPSSTTPSTAASTTSTTVPPIKSKTMSLLVSLSNPSVPVIPVSVTKAPVSSRAKPVDNRFEDIRPKSAALDKISISNNLGTTSGLTSSRMNNMRQIFDRETRKRIHISSADHHLVTGLLDKNALEENEKWARESQTRNKTDSTWGLLQTKGFLEAVGSADVYQSELSFGHTIDPKVLTTMHMTRDLSHCVQKNDVHDWHESAIKQSIQIFPKGESLKF